MNPRECGLIANGVVFYSQRFLGLIQTFRISDEWGHWYNELENQRHVTDRKRGHVTRKVEIGT